jgi:amino acid transporter
MARKAQRKVTRSGNRQTIVKKYGQRQWYELPDWLRVWLANNAAWIVLAWAIFLAPAVLLATVLGAHSLPLQFLGIPSTANDIGVAAIALIVQFILLVLAFRPMRKQKRSGWYLVIASTVVYLLHSILLQHAISASFGLAVMIYVYWQVRQELA